MPENLMCKAHKGTNQASRDGWDETFLPIGKRVISNTHTARIAEKNPRFLSPCKPGEFNYNNEVTLEINGGGVIFDPVNYAAVDKNGKEIINELQQLDAKLMEISEITEYQLTDRAACSLRKAAEKALAIEEQFSKEE